MQVPLYLYSRYSQEQPPAPCTEGLVREGDNIGDRGVNRAGRGGVTQIRVVTVGRTAVTDKCLCYLHREILAV